VELAVSKSTRLDAANASLNLKSPARSHSLATSNHASSSATLSNQNFHAVLNSAAATTFTKYPHAWMATSCAKPRSAHTTFHLPTMALQQLKLLHVVKIDTMETVSKQQSQNAAAPALSTPKSRSHAPLAEPTAPPVLEHPTESNTLPPVVAFLTRLTNHASLSILIPTCATVKLIVWNIQFVEMIQCLILQFVPDSGIINHLNAV
jgi:hypothetical protein